MKRFFKWYISSWKEEWQVLLPSWGLPVLLVGIISALTPDSPKSVTTTELIVWSIITLILMPLIGWLGKHKNR